ncbi:hypothetical protein PHAVU_010G038000 [Phaseolus vulgaris]|uniref:Polygalacturonase n=1 Tax=Phaseolus vulgaris TaxID=3885 RepID=V7AM38_PHAVU|nr:hypothetical protein PHAVU_010G038000g [Phaseolus vulgaris]ESW06320.1 hypothetical protein PHAVU_010G038000g [Phaseolus vulgaris]
MQRLITCILILGFISATFNNAETQVKYFNVMDFGAHGDGTNSPNTDGFDIVGSKNVAIEDSTLATGDDCIAINGGCSYINATRLVCEGGHGISIGSLGRNQSHETVEEVHVWNCSFIDTTNGARIKTWPGGSGYARKITYEEIILEDVQNSIIIDQFYGIKTPNEVPNKVVYF